ncbi:hypothetical protein MCAP1_000922 [Malassezia caprae]|uniref:Meiotically up-regulated protein Msb1/Mug8 domain-containing protein n=1 Tax=Malassezia caprae TaxID=1381934 RepID=A0AAF0IVP3_9BASI|nr:hypothetical protein MCAP1_000922 [Malassezia caprae]
MVTDKARPSNESDRLYTSSSPALAWIASHSRPSSAGPSPVLNLSPLPASFEVPNRAPPSAPRASLGLGLDMDADLSRPLPSLPSEARLHDAAASTAGPAAPEAPVPSAAFSPGPWDLTDSFVQSNAPLTRRPTVPRIPVYGYTGLAWEHQLDMEVATAYVIRTIERIRALGVDSPLLLSSMAVDLSASDSVRLIRTVVDSLSAPSAEADRALDQELQFANVYSLVALLKWVLARIGRVVAERAPGQTGQPLVLVQERGVVPWPSYMSWRVQEQQQGYPTNAYLALTQMLETRVARLLDVLMDFFALVATHSSQNQMTPSRIGRHMGVLLFGLPEDASFADTYAWYVQASNATEHMIVAFMRYHVSVATQSTYLPRRLLRLIDDYPRMLSPELDASSASVRTVPATYMARHVQRYAKDLLQRGAWPAALASMELGPDTRKQLNLVPGHVPRPGSSLQAPDVANETADGLGTPSMQRWHEFAFEGFDDLDSSALAFDLRESDRRQRMQRVESMHWFQFEERGFHQGADDNSRWDWVMRLDEPPHDRSDSALQRNDSATFDGPAPPFPYRPEPHVADTVIDELFPEVWADYLVGNGWSNRDERVHREASFAVLQLRAAGSDGRTPTAAWFVLEEVVPAKYRDALDAAQCPARRSRPMLRKLNQFRMVRAGQAPESIVAVLYRFPPEERAAPQPSEAPKASAPSSTYTVPAPGPSPAPSKHATVLPPRTIPSKSKARPASPTAEGTRSRPNRKSVPLGLQAKAAAAASPPEPAPESAPAPEPEPRLSEQGAPHLNKKRSIHRIFSSLGSPRSSESPRPKWGPFSPRVPSEAEGETPERVPRILSGIRKRSSQWLLKGKESLRSLRSVSGDEEAEATSPRMRGGFGRFVHGHGSHERPMSQAPVQPEESELVQPAEESEPVQPAEVSKPVQPAEVSKPVQPAEVSKPVQPAEVSRPVQPAEVSKPVQPAEVSRPVQPAEVSEPVQPAEESEPVQPAEVSKPVQPAEVSKPVQPAEVSKPVQPAEVSKPVKSPKEPRTVQLVDPVLPAETRSLAEPTAPTNLPAPMSPPTESLPASPPGSPPSLTSMTSPLQTLPPLAETSPIHLSSPESSPALPDAATKTLWRTGRSPSPHVPVAPSGVRIVQRPSFERKKGGKEADLPPVPTDENVPQPPAANPPIQSSRKVSSPSTLPSPAASPAMSLLHSPASSGASRSPAAGANSASPVGPWAWTASPVMPATSPISSGGPSPVAPPMSWTRPMPTGFSSAAAYLSSPESTGSEFDDARSSGPGMQEFEAPRAAPAIPLGFEDAGRPPYRLSRISERSEDDVTRSLAHGTTDSHAQMADGMVPTSSSRTLTESEGETTEPPRPAAGLGLHTGSAAGAELPHIPEYATTPEPDGHTTPATVWDPAMETLSTGTHDAWAEAEEGGVEPVPAVQTPTFRTLELPEVTPDRLQPSRSVPPLPALTSSGLPPYLMQSVSGSWPAVVSVVPTTPESPERTRAAVPPASVTRSPRMDKLPVVRDASPSPEHVPVPAERDEAPPSSVPSDDVEEDDVDTIPLQSTVPTSLTSTVSRISLRADTSMEGMSPRRAPPRASTPKDESAQSPFLAGFDNRRTQQDEARDEPVAPLPSKPSTASMPAVPSIEDVSHTTMNGHTDLATQTPLRPPTKAATTPLAGFVPRSPSRSLAADVGLESPPAPAPVQDTVVSEPLTVEQDPPSPSAPKAHDAEKPVAQAPQSGSTITLRERQVSKPVVSEEADDAADTSVPGEFPM